MDYMDNTMKFDHKYIVISADLQANIAKNVEVLGLSRKYTGNGQRW